MRILYDGRWTDDRTLGEQALEALRVSVPLIFASAELFAARTVPLPFYTSFVLIELEVARSGGPERVYALHRESHTLWLDGDPAPIHEANDLDLELVDSAVLEYLRFFLYFLRTESGPFALLESPDDLTAAAPGTEDATPTSERHLAEARTHAVPAQLVESEGDAGWVATGVIGYEGTLFRVRFTIASDGLVQMAEDEPVDTLDGLVVPEYPPLTLLAAITAGGRGYPVPRPDADEPISEDRGVSEAIVAVLLEDALREVLAGDDASVWRRFNAETGADQPLEQLRRLIDESRPAVIIESDLPFVEDIVAGLVNRGNPTPYQLCAAQAISGDDTVAMAQTSYTDRALHLISFHAYRSVFDGAREAHALSISDAAVLIGCGRVGDVPSHFRQIADLVLRLPRIDRQRFARIFERVLGVRPAAGWDSGDPDWTRYLVPGDFQVPRRLALDADASLAYLRDRVGARLTQLTPDDGPALAELHGLGEARQVCQDLIDDIRAASAGTIPWSSVDRGLLLAGPPGTGKTTLARAVAQECGVKFVPASAAAWQSAGHLGDHLRAIAATFEEARRYAPAILFLDEVDSIGNREALSGDHAQYQREVINAVLAQFQGLDVAEPVFVIAATNYPDGVDPALRRPGRLDQTVHVPLPNIPGLTQIFDYYLAPLRAEGQVADDVDARSMAELTWGSTGAQVEFYVRGAVRRARRESRLLTQADLIAEVTRRPRVEEGTPPPDPTRVRKVAIHEGGHTVSKLVSSTRGEEITFITIVARPDGTEGFVASMPLEETLPTRRQLIEQVETCLAGRAAEELLLGPDEVTAGSGGSHPGSDLARAKALATHIVCQSGFGSLYWTEIPTAEQERAIAALLDEAYTSVRAKLQHHQELLEKVVDLLTTNQELSGNQLRELLG